MGEWGGIVGVAPTQSLLDTPVLCLGPTGPELSQTNFEKNELAFLLVVGLSSE